MKSFPVVLGAEESMKQFQRRKDVGRLLLASNEWNGG